MSIRIGTGLAALLVALAFGVVGGPGCAGETRSGNSNTNWLRTCETDSACGTGLSCLCGRCTIACSNQSCDGLGKAAECHYPSADECGGNVSIGGVCSAACTTKSDCAAFGLPCSGGVCGFGVISDDPSVVPSPDASTGSDADATAATPPVMDATRVDTGSSSRDAWTPSCVTEMALGAGQTCVRKVDGFAWCWGTNRFGELGDGTASIRSLVPVKVAPARATSFQVFAGYRRTCVRMNDATLWCSGANEHGQIGDGTALGESSCISPGAMDCRRTPTEVQLSAMLPEARNPQSSTVAIGQMHTCAITRDPSFNLSCWGSNENGQLGLGRPGSSICSGVPCENAPVPVLLLGTTVASVTAGERHTCALLNDESVTCWGDNQEGQLGSGITSCSPDGGVSPCFATAPQSVAALGSSVLQVVSGAGHNCVRRHDSSVWCWGRNDLGQLGDGTMSGANCPGGVACKATPVQVGGLPIGGIAEIAAGGHDTCVLAAVDRSIWCWGSNSNGQLGNGSNVDSAVPVQVSLPFAPQHHVVTIAVGVDAHACALLDDSTLWCWGANTYGELGNGTTGDRFVPVKANVCP